VLKHHLYRAEVARTLLFVFIIIGIGYELQSVRTVQIADEWGCETGVDVDHREFFQTADRSEQ
jgi:hypothetical protein